MKSYHQFCGVAKALDLVGERWTLLLLRDMLLGPRRFGDLLEGLPGLTTNLLAGRLQAMTRQGLIQNVKLPPPASGRVYELTPLGRELEPVVLALGAFGARWLTTPGKGDVLNPRWAMCSLKRRFRPPSALHGTLEFRIDGVPYQLHLHGKTLDIQDGAPQAADATLEGPRQAWFPLLGKRETLSALLSAGRLQRTGSAQLLNRFVRAVGARVS